MSYYIDHIILCDELTYGRMIEYWRQNTWDMCDVNRPKRVWNASKDSDDFVKTGAYLLYLSVNRRPDRWELLDWLSDDLGVDLMHFSFWTKGECDEGWSRDGTYAPDKDLPNSVVTAEYDDNCVNKMKAPEGYKTYEYCKIAVDPDIWDELVVDYTREKGIETHTPEEKLLQQISDELRRIEGLLERMIDNMGRQQS
ncbi:MAG: hypothetical protein J5813_01045 [Candidatus Methanomethylophilaceae archaeon]|nr:hypothetical protein [Candidatus Methanomethylophilaceae archaeon]